MASSTACASDYLLALLALVALRPIAFLFSTSAIPKTIRPIPSNVKFNMPTSIIKMPDHQADINMCTKQHWFQISLTAALGTSLIMKASTKRRSHTKARCALTNITARTIPLPTLNTYTLSGPCLRTGAMICRCNIAVVPKAVFGAEASGLTHCQSKSKRKLVQRGVKFPNTDVEVDAHEVSFPVRAICQIGENGMSCDGTKSSTGVTGMIKFTQTDAEHVNIEYELKCLEPGDHGFHIHETADFSNGCASAGPHYNPFKQVHGGPDDNERHVGDLGNITAGMDGIAKGMIVDKFVKLFGEYSVIGRSVMIHADPDDLGRGPLEGWPEVLPLPAPAQHTKTTGNAGARIGCGEIMLV